MKKTKKIHYLEDVIFLTRTGVGYVAEKETKDGEIKIENQFLNTALHGDYVRVIVDPHTTRGQKTGKVVSVLARAKEEFVGTVHFKNNEYIVEPQDPRFYTYIKINTEGGVRIQENNKVLVKITDWGGDGNMPSGIIKENIGTRGEHETEIQAILLDRGIISDFSHAVITETKQIENAYTQAFSVEEKWRKDMRGVTTFTIDPEDAKDFDDALSVRKLQNGNYEIGVHIADVSFFVRKKTALDTEAARRSTSLYLVDRTIPMLPNILSNNLCSLRPNEDRLTFSAILEMTPQGQVKNKWFGKTIIHSNKRFTYEGAQKVLDEKRGEFYEELSVLCRIARHIRTKREEEGALSFAHDEVKFVLDEKGVPLSVFRKKQFETNKLIEEFMILANVEVARFMSEIDKNVKQSFIYRVHDLPDTEKIKELERVMHVLGYKTSINKKRITSKDIATLLKQVAGAPHEEMIHMLTVRALAKAIYTTKNIGHFGLSLKYYTHFTSPIRRYPDLVVHRMLFRYLNKEKISTQEFQDYEAISRYATQAEISAQEAERASIKYKQAEYMSAHAGEIFDGIITGLTERGIFVSEAETLSEGMISLRDLHDDYYVYDKKRTSVIGARTKKKYSLGDRVRIKVKRVDIEGRLIDYVFAE
ncbi:MAG: ribonuclease R [bacterium]|nr:ribonuclease R [bacterium]